MKIHWDLEQNSPEWHQVRLGKLTGSSASKFLVNGKSENGLGVDAIKYVYRKAAEWITQRDPYDFENYYTNRGHDLEPLAIAEYEEHTFETVDRPGFVERSSYIGCSPDGLVGDKGVIEVKCPEQEEFMRMVDLGKDAISKDYKAQVQFNMWVCNRQWCDLVYFHPMFMDKKLLIFRILPDPKIFERFELIETVFKYEVNRLTGLVVENTVTHA